MVIQWDFVHRFTLGEKTLISFATIGEDIKQLPPTSLCPT